MTTVRTNSKTDAQQSGALTGYEAELWRMADALRGSMDAAEYKHVVLGLIFWWRCWNPTRAVSTTHTAASELSATWLSNPSLAHMLPANSIAG